MSSFGGMQKERMAAYVQELLSQDRARQQATLETLSKYADVSKEVPCPESFASGLPMTDLGLQGVFASQTAGRSPQGELPVKVELPAARSPEAQDVAATSRLQHATEVLQAALANWEACMQGDGEALTGQRAPPEVAVPGLVPPPGLRGTDDRTKLNPQKSLEKALSQINQSLPPATADKATSLLEAVVAAKEEAVKNEAQEKLILLAQLLQSQNQASMDKVFKMLVKDQSPPMRGGMGMMDGRAMAAMGPFAGTPMVPPTWPYAMNAMPNTMPMAQPPYTGPPSWWPNTGGSPAEGPQRKGGGPKKRNTEGAGAPEGSHAGDTLRMHLRSLLQVDSSRVLIVRKINRLGFSSPQILKEHFSWYGTVENVLVAHSRVKSGGGQAGIVSRLRPSGLGFVVMSKGEEAAKILGEGAEQLVSGTVIRVQKFERRMSESGLEELSKEDCSSESRAMGG